MSSRSLSKCGAIEEPQIFALFDLLLTCRDLSRSDETSTHPSGTDGPPGMEPDGVIEVKLIDHVFTSLCFFQSFLLLASDLLSTQPMLRLLDQ